MHHKDLATVTSQQHSQQRSPTVRHGPQNIFILQYTYMFEADLIIAVTIYVPHGVEEEKKYEWDYLTRHPKLLWRHGFKQFGNHWSLQMFNTVQSNVQKYFEIYKNKCCTVGCSLGSPGLDIVLFLWINVNLKKNLVQNKLNIWDPFDTLFPSCTLSTTFRSINNNLSLQWDNPTNVRLTIHELHLHECPFQAAIL